MTLNHYESGEPLESPLELRQTGSPGMGPYYESFGHIPFPKCLDFHSDLPSEISAKAGQSPDGVSTDDIILEVISRERECQGYLRWRRGVTPVEHRNIFLRESRDREAAEVRELALAREDERDRRAAQWHQEDMVLLQRQQRWQLAVLGVAVIIATLVGSMIQAGWIGRPW